MGDIKVLLVDDSALMRVELKKMIEVDSRIKVVSIARDGTEVLEKVQRYKPDVVTMDINMPIMNGIETLKLLMKEAPLPVIMVSALTFEGADETIEALSLGAFDFVHKPSGSITKSFNEQAEIIREKIIIAARNSERFSSIAYRSEKTVAVSRKKVSISKSLPPVKRKRSKNGIFPVVGVGVSTGGPKTLMSILPRIPADFNGAILICQHMPEKFTLSFSNRLNSICQLKVKEAEDGEIVNNGWIYVAPGGKHMRVKNRNNQALIIELVDDLPGVIFKPSVNALFDSLNKEINNNWIGVILTGMGADGATALADLRKSGGHTIAESESSCVVFGMPQKAIEMGGAEYVLDQEKIADKIIELAGGL